MPVGFVSRAPSIQVRFVAPGRVHGEHESLRGRFLLGHRVGTVGIVREPSTLPKQQFEGQFLLHLATFRCGFAPATLLVEVEARRALTHLPAPDGSPKSLVFSVWESVKVVSLLARAGLRIPESSLDLLLTLAASLLVSTLTLALVFDVELVLVAIFLLDFALTLAGQVFLDDHQFFAIETHRLAAPVTRPNHLQTKNQLQASLAQLCRGEATKTDLHGDVFLLNGFAGQEIGRTAAATTFDSRATRIIEDVGVVAVDQRNALKFGSTNGRFGHQSRFCRRNIASVA